ncbi:MAG: transcriptional regulator, partial [Acidimicrobiales bacterium]
VMSGWHLTPAGRGRHQSALEADLWTAACGAELEVGYDSFLGVNEGFKALCTDWQLCPGPDGQTVANAHTDPGYDASIRVRLKALHVDVRTLTA